jgi:nucleoside-diphosphate-sugar epimerase
MSSPVLTDHAIETLLSVPDAATIEAVRSLPGDFVVLGVGGKMGTTTAVMLRRALDAAGRTHDRVTGVSRFSRAETRAELEAWGVRTLACDLAEPEAVAALEPAPNVLFLAGQKFGTASDPGPTWIQNTVVPALVARRFAASRLVAFSTGCVYPFVPVDGPGASEDEPVAFLGEYASSCVGRERIFAHASRRHGTPLVLFRLNYAVELRYGVLVDIATKVLRGEPVDVSTGWLNCIWQRDACARALRCLALGCPGGRALNVTGPEKLRVRDLGEAFARRLGREARFVGTEAPTAWLADAREAERLFGPPETPLAEMIERTAAHLEAGGALLGKPTHFEARSGRF